MKANIDVKQTRKQLTNEKYIQAEKLKQAHSVNVLDLKKKAQADIKAKEEELEEKYQQIVNRIRQTDELERSRLLQDALQHGAARCGWCGDLFTTNVFCKDTCKQMW